MARRQPRRRNAEEGAADYHRRNVILDKDLALKAMEWHGGQGSMIYSLASTAYAGHFVSPSMIDAAVNELESSKGDTPDLQRELEELIGELDARARFSSESTTKEYGLGDVDDGYATWLIERESNPAPGELSGPLRLKEKRDGLWVVGQGLVVPVESRGEGKELIQRLKRKPNGTGSTVLTFDSPLEMSEGLAEMDVALRRSRLERPTEFRLDWGSNAIVLDAAPDDPGVDQAIRALERGDHRFELQAMQYAANPKGGSPAQSAFYSVGGLWVGSMLGFGLGALVGGLAGLAAGGPPGAVMGGLLAGTVGAYAGGIWGAAAAARQGAPESRESQAARGAAIGAAIPFLPLFTAPAGAYLGAD